MDDFKTVHYVTHDPLQHLKLKVTLTRLSADKVKSRASKPQGTETTTAADGSTQHVAAASDNSRPQPFKVSRTISWQEKVYSRAELVAAQANIRANQQRGAQLMSTKRNAHFGSQSHIGTDRLQTESPEGSILFTYVQTDEFCEQFETSKAVTTSSSESRNHLIQKLRRDPRNRQKMMNFHAMFIMADLGDEHTVAGSNEKVLCAIVTHQQGSFDMTPGFSTAGQKYRFEDDHGGIYEYVIEPASQTAVPCLEKRAAKLAVAVAAQAADSRKQGISHTAEGRSWHDQEGSLRLAAGLEGGVLRVVLLAELVAAAGFQRDRLYLEWQLQFDPDFWVLQHSEQEVVQPGVIQGVTQVSQMTRYPADPASDVPALWVAHFAHPIEVEWIAVKAPAPRDWPKLLIQVCTHDLWDRVTTEGYGWLSLGGNCPGSRTHYVDTWKPLGTRRDQQQAYFIGGSEELEDMTYIVQPKGHKGSVLNKYGCKTETSGTVKVRTHVILQTGAPGSSSPRRVAANRRAITTRQKRELSLAVVLERARSRLQEARGGEVTVREGVVSQRPTITVQPVDASVQEGSTVQFTVKATGLGPLRYQWFKDSKRLTVATSNTPLLVLVDVGPSESGSYHCQVSNKDGAATSSKALLTIARVGRMQQATGASSSGSASGASNTAAATPSLSDTFSKRSTVPRTPVSRGGLPYSPRFASAAGGRTYSSGGSVAGTTSPLRTSLASLSPLSRQFATVSTAATGGASNSSNLQAGRGSLEIAGSKETDHPAEGAADADSSRQGVQGEQGQGRQAHVDVSQGAQQGPARQHAEDGITAESVLAADNTAPASPLRTSGAGRTRVSDQQ